MSINATVSVTTHANQNPGEYGSVHVVKFIQEMPMGWRTDNSSIKQNGVKIPNGPIWKLVVIQLYVTKDPDDAIRFLEKFSNEMQKRGTRLEGTKNG